jgi:hypothetical protein
MPISLDACAPMALIGGMDGNPWIHCATEAKASIRGMAAVSASKTHKGSRIAAAILRRQTQP